MKLVLKDIEKRYGKNTKKALDHINIEFEPGVYGMLGPNGAGKSTMMNIITTNIKADKGQVLYDNSEVKKLGKAYRKKLGFMPQQQKIYPTFTGKQFLWYMAALKGMKKEQAREQIEELVRVVNLEMDIFRKIGTYSGGMKQRLLLAQALLDNPSVVLLDEPTAGLDPKERIRIRNYISQMAKEKIVIFATHVVSDVEFIADKIFILKDGQILGVKSVEEWLETVEGKVYEVIVEHEKLNAYQEKYQVANMSRIKGLVKLRIISDQKPEGEEVKTTHPNLEDVYLYYCANGE